MLETKLEPLKQALIKENLFENDWDDVIAHLDGTKKLIMKRGQKKDPAFQMTDDEFIGVFYGMPMGHDLIAEVIEGEKRRAKIKDLSRKLLLDGYILDSFKGNSFLTEVSRFIRKTRATSWRGVPMPTAALCYNVELDDFEMVWNPEFFASLVVDYGPEEGSKMIHFVFAHELYHFILKHVTVRRRTPAFGWNIATDAANNSLLVASDMKMPEFCIYPSRLWKEPKIINSLRTGKMQRFLTPEEKAMREELSELIASWPTLLSSEWYFNDLMRWAKENGHGVGERGITPYGGDDGEECDFSDMGVDMHDLWDEVPEETRERLTERTREVMKGAAQKADNQARGWGKIPASIQKDIRAFINNTIGWEKLLQQFFGSFTRGERVKSIKRINKKYPYEHPGHRRTYLPKLVIAIDQSGSVSDDNIALMFGVIFGLSKLIDFTIIFFDTEVDTSNIVTWKRGQRAPKLTRTRTGGTDFNAPVLWANSPENAGKYDGMVILTDGECSEPVYSRMKKAWLIVPGRKLLFNTRDTVIQMEETTGKRAGAIR